MDGNSCFFIGHRDVGDEILSELQKRIERLIVEENVTYFYVGNYGGFDRLAAAAIKKAKLKHHGIVLMLVLPYHPTERPIELTHGFDGSIYPDGMESVPRRYAIVRVNQYMVNASDWLVCYVRHGAGNSGKLLEYAKKREKKGLIRIENLAENR